MSDVDIKIRLEAAKAEAQLAKFNAQLGITAEKEKQAQLQTDILQSKLRRLDEAAQTKTKTLNTLNIAFASFIGNITSRAVSAGITSIINGVRGLIGAGKDFEAGLIQIAKTTGLGEQATKLLGDRITDISKRVPVATESLLEIATVAGQLGIKGVDNIAAFTETLAKLQLATDIAGQEGSQSVARILTVTGELEQNGTDNIEKFGSVITKLGNDFAATEAQILEIGNKVAQGTVAYQLASEDVLALSTAFKVTGSEAEVSGTTAAKVFEILGKATVEGGENLTRLAEATGISREAFQQLFKDDPVAAFARFAEGLKNTGLEGAELTSKLRELGITDTRVLRTLTPLISNYEVLGRSINTARKEAVDRNALEEETQKATNSLAADLTDLSNTFKALGKELFKTFGPALRSIVQGLTDFIDFSIKSTDQLVTFTLVAGTTGFAALTLAGKLGTLSGALGLVTVAARAAWVALTGPVGIAASIALGLGLIAVKFKEVADANREAQQSFQETETLNSLAEGYANADKETKTFLDTLSSSTGIYQGLEIPLAEHRTSLDAVSESYVTINNKLDSYVQAVKKSTELATLFERDRVKELSKFFTDEEKLRLQSKFATLSNKQEIEAFENFVFQEGKRRREQEYAAVIGLDRATLDAKKQQQKQLEELRQGQFDFEKSLRDQEWKEQEELRVATEERILAQQQTELARQTEEQIALDSQLAAYQEYFTRREQAEIQAAIRSAKTETQKQLLIEKALKAGADRQRQLEETKNQAILNSTAGFFGALAAVARTGTGKSFEIFKAAAIAQTVISTYAAITKTLQEPTLPFPANKIQAAAIGIQGFANVRAITSQSPGFEQGGIVPGTSFTGDNVTARVNSGEMILNRQQQQELFKVANGQSTESSQKEIVVYTTVELDGEKIGESVSRQVANGLVLGEVQ